MDNQTRHEFKTRSGICAIAPEQITFTRPDPGTRRGSSRASLLYVAAASLMFGFGIYLFLRGDTLMALILIMAGLAFPWLTPRNESASGAPNIPRQAIRQVEAHAPRPPITRGYFVVSYEADGKSREQTIVVAGGADEYARAVDALRAAGLLET